MLLYSLRFESERGKIDLLKDTLRTKLGVNEEQIGYVDCLLKYAGKSQRSGELFKKGMMNDTKKFLNSVFGEDVKHVLLQHKTWLNSVILE